MFRKGFETVSTDVSLPRDVFHTKTKKLIPTNHAATWQKAASPSFSPLTSTDFPTSARLFLETSAEITPFPNLKLWDFSLEFPERFLKDNFQTFRWFKATHSTGALEFQLSWENAMNAQKARLIKSTSSFPVLSLLRISDSVVWRLCQKTSEGSDRTTSTWKTMPNRTQPKWNPWTSNWLCDDSPCTSVSPCLNGFALVLEQGRSLALVLLHH